MEENIIDLIGEITKLSMKLNNKYEDDFFVRNRKLLYKQCFN